MGGVLHSCALLSQKRDPLAISQALSKLCLTGSGKGRIEYAKGRHLFSYESLWKSEENKWAIAFSLPIIGQELLSLQVRQVEPVRLGVEGTFATRLKNDIRSDQQRRLLRSFYGAVGRFLLVVKNPKDEKSIEKWQLEFEEGELKGKYPVSKSTSFTLRAFDLGDQFGRLQFVLRDTEKFDHKISLDLFISDCSL